jgi:diguanylate cyclase (GGDEF)-like protein
MTLVTRAPTVPLRALVLSAAALAVPVFASFFMPHWTEEQMGVLVWLTALVPAFMLAYYRGSKGVALALAGGMAVLSVTQVLVLLLGVANPNWALLLGVVGLYFAISVGIAIFAEMLHRDRRAAEQLALVDRLTGLPNRRAAEFTLDSEFAAAMRGRTVTVVVFDLDHFKRVNDQYGHAAGDEALRAFAKVLKTNTRRMNLSARFGGEEFITVLAEAGVQQAVSFANRVRNGISALEFPWGRTTVSAGVAAYQEGMGSYEVLVAAADRALYAAKEGGRDRIEVVQEFVPGKRRISYSALAAPVESAAQPSLREKVLVVDDDPEVRRSLASLLSRFGYHSEHTDDPHEVISRYRDGATDIDLLIMDVMMPKMNGLTLVDRICALGRDVRVVYMSGYMQGEVSWAGLPGWVVGFLEKPIEAQQLLAMVRDVLDDPGPDSTPDRT